MDRRWVIVSILSVAALGWASALAFGLRGLARYETTPGSSGAMPSAWPAGAPPLNSEGYTLALFLHPECPCTRATLSSLDSIIAHSGGKVRTYAFAVIPDGAPPEWQESPLVAEAGRISGVKIIPDVSGCLARACGAETSGHALLFDATGHLLFSGGITDSRGHAGDSRGMQMILDAVRGRAAGVTRTPVFGCSLMGENCPTPATGDR